MALFGKLKARLAQTTSPLEARLDAVLSGMKPRDRMLFGGIVGAVLLVLVFAVAFGMRSSLNGLRGDLEKEQNRLTQVVTMASQYAQDAQRVEELEEALNEHRGKDLSAFLEQAASKAQAADSLKTVTPTATTTVGGLEQKNFTASLKKVTLEQALEFLYEAEASGYPLKIESATIKVERGASKLLSLNLEIATFALIEEETG